MEGVPRLPMLGFELKSSDDHVDFSTSLRSYITEIYSENADMYKKECNELDQLRKLAVSSSLDFIGCSNMKKYFCQIEFLCSRFPTTDGCSLEILFTWEDTISQQMVSLADIKFEQANILFNIGCLHSKLGSMDNRMTPEGMKVSCTHFQCAAWMFQHLRDSFDKFKCLDFNKDLLSFMSITMLAQAQECILEKSMTDNRKSSITAKVSAQIVEYCNAAIKHLNIFASSTTSGSKMAKEWKKRLELKVGFYDCITLYYMGLNAEDQNKWGERLAYLQAAVSCLEDLMKNNKVDDASVDETLKFMVDIIGGKFNSSKKDNDFIYHDKVPSLGSLPEIKGASLVKGIPLNVNDPEVSGQDIFIKLVPFVVHQKSSLYSEEKAKILRKIGSEIEAKDQELRKFLSVLQLNTDDSILPTSTKIPDLLLEKCASMSVRPNSIKDLTCAMQTLSSKSMDVEGDLNTTLEIVSSVENGIQEMPKSSADRMNGQKECEELKGEWKKHEETLRATSQINEGLHEIMEKHVINLKILSSSVQSVYSAISDLQYNPSESELEILQDMKKLMTKVDDMMKQRIQLEEKLRDQMKKDDITQILVVSSDVNHSELFKEQLEKHSQQISLINQNLIAQENILQALTETNVKYADIKKHMTAANEKQKDFIDGLIKSYEVYEDLLTKTQQGIDLYGKIGVHISKLLVRAENLFKHLKKNAIAEKVASGVAHDTKATKNVVNHPNVAMDAVGNNTLKDISQVSLKLKDYLPFMKPDTFGQGSLPNVAQKYPEIPRAETSNSASIPQDASFNMTSSLPATTLASLNLINPNHAVSISPYSILKSPSQVPRFCQSSTTPTVVQFMDSVNKFAPQQIRFTPGLDVRPVLPFADNLQPIVRADMMLIKNDQLKAASVMQKIDITQNRSMDLANQTEYFNVGIKSELPCSLVLSSGVQQPGIYQAAPASFPLLSTLQHQRVTQPTQYPGKQQLQHLSHDFGQEKVQQAPNFLHHPPMQQPTQFHGQEQQVQLQQMQHFNQRTPQHQAPIPSNFQNSTLSAQVQHFQQPHHFQSYNQIFGHLLHNTQIQATPHHPCHLQAYDSQPQCQNKLTTPPLSQENQNIISNSNIVHAHTALPNYHDMGLLQSFSQSNTLNINIKGSPNHSIPLNDSLDCGRTNTVTVHNTTDNIPNDQYRKKSLDEMLLNGNISDQASSVLIPKVITDEDVKREQSEEAKKNLKLNFKDCYAEPEFLLKFVDEVDKFKTHVDEICKPSSKVLENKWKELNEAQDKSTRSLSMAIARCYPLKNRQQDVMPFDNSRVKLIGAQDDYINASLIKSMSLACPDVITTQAPLPVTFADFWQMVYDYNVEVIVMLCSENETLTKGQSYWPNDKGHKATSFGNFAITLHSIQVRPLWTERVIGILNSKTQVSRSVIHLNFHSWPPGAEPENCDGLLEFIGHVHDLYLQQRSLLRPIIIHCSNGVGRSGTFVAIYTAVQHINQGLGIVDVCHVISQMRAQRKNFIEFERQLKFCYIAILQHATNVLKTYGIQSHVHLIEPDASKNKETVPLEAVQKESTDCPVPSLPQSLVGDGKVSFEPQQSQDTVSMSTSSIMDLQNPEKFSLDCKSTKHKITKTNFFSHAGLLGIKTSLVDPTDPLNELDPLWTMKK